MAWRGQFKLGRPNQEALFEINPSAMTFDERKLVDTGRAIDGSLTAVTQSRFRPVFPINGNYVSPAFLNQLRSLVGIDDTFLVFEPLDLTGNQIFENMTERVIPSDLTHVPIPDNSYLRGSALRVAAGGASTITPIGLWSAPGAAGGATGQGPNLLLGGTGAPIFSTGFEAPTYTVPANPLAGQDLWTNVVAPATTAITVAGPLTGLQSVKSFAAAGTSPTDQRLFPLTAQPWQAQIQFQLSMAGAGANATWVIAPAPFPGGVSVSVNLDIAGVLTLGNSTGPMVVIPAFVQVAPYLFTVQVTGGVATVFYNGAVVGSFAVALTSARAALLQATSAVGTTNALWDQLNIQTLGVASTYDDANRQLILANALPNLNPLFVTYQATAIAAHLKGVPGRTEGGMVDVWRYDLEIEGA